MASLSLSINDDTHVGVVATYYNATNTDLSIAVGDLRILIMDYTGGAGLNKIADEIMKVAKEADLRNAIEAEVTARLTEVEA